MVKEIRISPKLDLYCRNTKIRFRISDLDYVGTRNTLFLNRKAVVFSAGAPNIFTACNNEKIFDQNNQVKTSEK